MNLLKTFILILVCYQIQCTSELPAWHMKPLGSHKPADKVDETFVDDLISPQEFADKYIIPRKPLVFRDVTKMWPAFKLWTDEYLTNQYGDMELRLEGKKEKFTGVPHGDVCMGRDRMKTFINDYRKGADKYIVSDLPTTMYKDVNILPSMSCGDFLTSFVEIDLWMNSDLGKKGEGGNSLLHKDAFNTVNCVVNGTKEWKLIELKYNDFVYQSWEGALDAGYGGFSLINPDKVDATKFPDVDKIEKWQFVSINAGDCLYLPSQMWHQVKSFGETNRAVAFLFKQFQDNEINASCGDDKPNAIPLSEVDVDLQYSGKGNMPMGGNELDSVRETLKGLVSSKLGYITKKQTYRVVYTTHSSGFINKHLILEKAKQLYVHLLKSAGENKETMTSEFINNLSHDQIRPVYDWLFPIEPANTYNHEYSIFVPEELRDIIGRLQEQNGGVIKKQDFITEYLEDGGTIKFAEDFWQRLAGTEESITDVSKTLEHALEKYEYYRRDNPEDEGSDDDVIITPQGHKSQPKKFEGGYAIKDKEENENFEADKKVEL